MTTPDLSLRDYFAGQIIGHLASGVLGKIKEVRINDEADRMLDLALAESAYELADAMIAAREKGLTVKDCNRFKDFH